jgi:hypothetical protein
MKRTPLRLAEALALALALATPACSLSVGKWSYPSGNYPTTVSPSPSKVVVAVLPFEDARGWTKQSAIPLWPIPLVPYVSGTFERPEATDPGEFTPRYECTPTEDLPKAVAAELEREKVVARAFFSYGGDDVRAADYELRGRIDAFEFTGTVISYGISYYAYVLWALGLPRSYRDNRIALTLELRKRDSQQVVWSAVLHDEDSLIESLYYGSPYYRYPRMIERQLRPALTSFARVLGAEPAPIPPELEAARERH